MVDLEVSAVELVLQVENVVEHLWHNDVLVDGHVDDGRGVLLDVHQREETSVLHLLFGYLGDIPLVVSPGASADNTERDQDTLEFPETSG